MISMGSTGEEVKENNVLYSRVGSLKNARVIDCGDKKKPYNHYIRDEIHFGLQ
jgi:hypothetical protein